ncbi:unnamed protein product, partial [marine sediment metagenome]
AVNNVSFDVKDGEVISLIGESGSGKSTIGKMILGLISISSGMIRLNGVDIATLKGRALKDYYRNVQGVFQDPFSSYNPIFKADRIFRIIREEFFPKINNREWDKKIDSSLRAVGLNPDEVLNKYPHQLSGGQLQRFLIARALLLDVSTQKAVAKMLVEFRDREFVKSLIVITHDISILYQIAGSIMIMYAGKLAEKASTEAIINSPLHPYTKLLISSLPDIGIKYSQKKLTGIPGKPPLLLD